MSITVYDWRGQVRDWAYLVARYGELVIQPSVPDVYPQWRVVAFREVADGDFDAKALLEAGTKLAREHGGSLHDLDLDNLDLDELGLIDRCPDEAAIEASNTLIVNTRAANVRVAWYWPDAPQNPAGPLAGVPSQMRSGRAVSGVTNVNGDAGFGMGSGAYYWPGAGQIGPHAAWVYGEQTNSELVLGLGMVALTNHYHVDVEFERVDEPEPPQPPPPPPPVDPIMAEIAKIRASCDRIEAELVC